MKSAPCAPLQRAASFGQKAVCASSPPGSASPTAYPAAGGTSLAAASCGACTCAPNRITQSAVLRRWSHTVSTTATSRPAASSSTSGGGASGSTSTSTPSAASAYERTSGPQPSSGVVQSGWRAVHVHSPGRSSSTVGA